MTINYHYDFYGSNDRKCLIVKLFMTQINSEFTGKQRQRAGVQRMKKALPKIDMTPMVDLGFLLISFFVITTELSRPRAMDLFMPADGPPMDLGESNAMTVLLDDENTIFYYYGGWKNALKEGSVFQSAYSGENSIRNRITEKQTKLAASPKNKEGKEDLMLLVKATDKASYENLVDVLDEAAICMVKKHAIVKISPEETNWLRQRIRQ